MNVDNNGNPIPHFLDFEGRKFFAVDTLSQIKASEGDEKALEKISKDSKQALKRLKNNPLENLILKIVGFFLRCFHKEAGFLESQQAVKTLKKTVSNNCYYFSKVKARAGTTTLKELIAPSHGNPAIAKYLLKSHFARENFEEIKQFHLFLKQPEFDKEKLYEKYTKLNPKVRKLLIASLCVAYQKPARDIAFAEELIKRNPKALLAIVNTKQETLPQQIENYLSGKAAMLKDLGLLKALEAGYDSEESFKGMTQATQEKLSKKGFKLSEKQPENHAAVTAFIQEFKAQEYPLYMETFPRLINLHHGIKPVEPANMSLTQPVKLTKALNITMVGVECTKIVKQGGLAEAIYGMAQGMLNQKADGLQHKLRLVLPKYDILPQEIQSQLKEKAKYAIKTGTDGKVSKVFKAKLDGIRCYFIEDSDPNDKFAVTKSPSGDNLNVAAESSVYGPDPKIAMDRFALFSALAADLVYKMKEKTDILHLHDWHVAGTAIKLEKEHSEEWKSGKIPPVVFTFHNNNQSGSGIYDYKGVMESLRKLGYVGNAADLFKDVLERADAVTTVSESFAWESQQDLAESDEVKATAALAVRQAALKGKFAGILNGSNPDIWNPETSQQLKNWIDPITKQPVSLCYGPTDDIVAKKQKIKEQLGKWLSVYKPEVKIDLNKPIVTYVGRYDSSQKGLDLFETAIKETLTQGGQVILMGSQEDEIAKGILDKIEKKYKDGVFVIRDSKVIDQKGNAKWKIQQGTEKQPGIGWLVRASTDLLLVPSNYEPCGLVQFEGWLTGCLAIGSATGGLKDTIKPLGTPHFNGFLFDRNPQKDLDEHKEALKDTLKEAISYWKHLSKENKNSLMGKLIDYGRKYSWTSAPEGLSPVEKYFAVYSHARERVSLRNPDLKYFDIFQRTGGQSLKAKKKMEWLNSVWLYLMKSHSSLRFKNLPFANKSVRKKQVKYYEGMLNDEKVGIFELDKAYQGLSQQSRQFVQSPYATRAKKDSYNHLGAHIQKEGTSFSVSAPNAQSVVLKLLDDKGSIRKIEMKKQADGTWNAFVPGIAAGQKYQYIINGQVKIDPYGIGMDRAEGADKAPYSIVSDRVAFEWTDSAWIDERRKTAGSSKPLNIYEVYPTRWKRKNGAPLNYREMAVELAAYCKEMGFTHVELMGILEHHNEDSWGYRVTNFFAPNSRMGSIDDFKYMVDYLHKQNIGVVLDWVPAHFAKDKYGLGNFDGSAMYEPSFWRKMISLREYFFRWNTHFFDFKSEATRELLLSSALYWTKEMHIDGLRVDAVKSMYYSDDPDASRVFLRDLNAVVHGNDSSVITIAEDYTGSPATVKPASEEGLGFNMKWNVGWKHHVQNYFKLAPHRRKSYYQEILNAAFADGENPGVRGLSHDEVAAQNGQKVLIEQTPGLTQKQKFANQRLLLSFLGCLPGGRLSFMGNEFGATHEWDKHIKEGGSVDWNESEQSGHKGLKEMCKALNKFNASHSAFWNKGNGKRQMDWIEESDEQHTLLAYRLSGETGEQFACLHNFSMTESREFVVRFNDPNASELAEVFNSDDKRFGGEGRSYKDLIIVKDEHDRTIGYKVLLPPLSTVIISETKTKPSKSVVKKID